MSIHIMAMPTAGPDLRMNDELETLRRKLSEPWLKRTSDFGGIPVYTSELIPENEVHILMLRTEI